VKNGNGADVDVVVENGGELGELAMMDK